ncbi:hypothetical protein [Romboutsia lituseburensis]|uniref:hypothetical protein n=1 Tax=Romboutsia lituseburensis TaxID=1537 RepID=UPI00215A7D7C|nr:hypothetical protein [Romboutsia lituseburensis]MCR8744606.1 hypothetical protein [Romboutsia lituseburensis]
MAFICENSHEITKCGKYVQEYLGNLEYVSNGILSLINTKILPSELIVDGKNAPFDLTNDKCVCLPLTSLHQNDTAVFDCTLWEIIKNSLIIESTSSTDTQGYLVVLCQTLQCILANTANINHGFASQLERLHCLCESLETRLDSVSCNNRCPEIIGDLLCLLMQILTKLISAISKAAVLVYYADCSTQPIATANKVVSSFFSCMICDFVNDLCELEKLVPELSSIVIGFATCDTQSCTPCYIAQSAPRKVRPVCPPSAMYGGNSGYGQYNGGGCGCGCKKR